MQENRKPLHVHVKPIEGQVFNKEIGWLSLPKAGAIKVSVKAFFEESEQINAEKEQIEKKIRQVDEDLEIERYKFKELGDRRLQVERGKWLEKEKYNGKLVYRAQVNYEMNVSQAERRAKEKKANLKAELDKVNKRLQDLTESYEDVRWVWQLIGSTRPDLDENSFNEALNYVKTKNKGQAGETKELIGAPTFDLIFSEFLEGGGAAYLEPYWKGSSPVGKYPHGILINSQGKKAEILMADWRDANNDVITETIAFGSVVYLNIYTSGHYGHNLEIQLLDKDKVLRYATLGLTNADDKLHATEYLDNSVKAEERTEEDITKQENRFKRPVSVYAVDKAPDVSKYGKLVIEDDKRDDLQYRKLTYVQKCMFAVFIDPLWEALAGDKLEIYPTVYSPKTKEKVLSDNLLKVGKQGKQLVVEEINSNQVAVISQVETNLQSFHPCGYNTIVANFEKRSFEIFTRETSTPKKQLSFHCVLSEKPETISLFSPDLDTSECTYNEEEGYHEDHFISISNPDKLTKLAQSNTKVSFDLYYPRPSDSELLRGYFLQRLLPIEHLVSFSSCRFQHDLKIEVYPDVEYHFNAHLGVDEDQYLYVTQSKKYNKRKYKAKRGSDTRATRKKYNKQRKEKYREDVNNEITANNFLQEYSFSVEFEASWADKDKLSIESEFATVEDIIRKVVYIFTTIDSYLGGTALENELKNPVKAKEFNRQEKKRKLKKGGLPVRFEVSPPKFTGGVSWKYAPSLKDENAIGVLYKFKLGALPLVNFKGRLDLLFAAQFIPYVNGVVKALDSSVMAIAAVGDAMEYFGIGNMEADYYFDLVIETNLNIDLTSGAEYHTIDGFAGGQTAVYSEMTIGLEAGGYLKVEVFDIVAEAALHADAKAKFILTWKPDKPKVIIFEFEGIEAKIEAKIEVEKSEEESEKKITNKNTSGSVEVKKEKTKNLNEVKIFEPFELEIALFG